MICQNEGEYIEYDDIRYAVGQRIRANENSDYDGAVGIIVEISDEEDGVDIYCDLERPEDPEIIAKFEKRFSRIFGEPKTIGEIPFDEIVLQPDEIDIPTEKQETATDLLTEEIEKKFESHPFGSQEGKGLDAEVLVKYFNPYGAGTWLITEAKKQKDGDWMLYGYYHVLEWEWGSVMLSSLVNKRVSFLGCKLPLERDLYSKGTVREML